MQQLHAPLKPYLFVYIHMCVYMRVCVYIYIYIYIFIIFMMILMVIPARGAVPAAVVNGLDNLALFDLQRKAKLFRIWNIIVR